MLALSLIDVKDFMNKFLRSEIFDHFLLQEGVIQTAASYVIDGKINDTFYTSEEKISLGLEDDLFLPYSMLRQNFFDLIKGKNYIDVKFEDTDYHSLNVKAYEN